MAYRNLVSSGHAPVISQRYPSLTDQTSYAKSLVGSVDTSPVQSHTEGVARLLKALVGGWMGYDANQQIKEKEAARKAGIKDFVNTLSAGVDEEIVTPGSAPVSAMTDSAFDFDYGGNWDQDGNPIIPETKEIRNRPLNSREMSAALGTLAGTEGNAEYAQGIEMQRALRRMERETKKAREDEVYERAKKDAADAARLKWAQGAPGRELTRKKDEASIAVSAAQKAKIEAETRAAEEKRRNRENFIKSLMGNDDGLNPASYKGDQFGGGVNPAVFVPGQTPSPFTKVADNLKLVSPLGGGTPAPKSQPTVRQIFKALPPEVQMGILNSADPQAAFSKELLSKKGLDIQFGPGGQVLSVTQGGRRTGNMAPRTKGEVENRLLNAGDLRSRMSQIKSSFRPEYHKNGEKIAQWMANLRDTNSDLVPGLALPPEQARSLRQFTTYRANLGQNFSAILKELSGVAVNPTEFDRAREYVPNKDDGPSQVWAKIQNMENFANMAIAKYHYISKKGLSVKDVNVEDMPRLMQDRGNELARMAAERGVPEDQIRARVVQQLSYEFGLAGE